MHQLRQHGRLHARSESSRGQLSKHRASLWDTGARSRQPWYAAVGRIDQAALRSRERQLPSVAIPTFRIRIISYLQYVAFPSFDPVSRPIALQTCEIHMDSGIG